MDVSRPLITHLNTPRTPHRNEMTAKVVVNHTMCGGVRESWPKENYQLRDPAHSCHGRQSPPYNPPSSTRTPHRNEMTAKLEVNHTRCGGVRESWPKQTGCLPRAATKTCQHPPSHLAGLSLPPSSITAAFPPPRTYLTFVWLGENYTEKRLVAEAHFVIRIIYNFGRWLLPERFRANLDWASGSSPKPHRPTHPHAFIPFLSYILIPNNYIYTILTSTSEYWVWFMSRI